MQNFLDGYFMCFHKIYNLQLNNFSLFRKSCLFSLAKRWFGSNFNYYKNLFRCYFVTMIIFMIAINDI